MRLDLSFLRRPDLGSVLLGRTGESPRRRSLRVQALLVVSLLASNLVGVAISTTLVFFVLPGPFLLTARFVVPTAIVTPVYVTAATVVGALWAGLAARRDLRWSLESREPTPAERKKALRVPWRLTLAQAFLWMLGAVVVTTAYGLVDPDAIAPVGFTIVFSGLVVCGAAYLYAEFGLRPVAALALASDHDVAAPTSRTAGAMTRVRVMWALGSGIPILGLIIVAVYTLAGRDITAERLSVVILVLGGTSLLIGYLLIRMLAASLLAPVRSVRWAMEDLTEGELSRRVVVYDGSELGRLQSGFNRMAEGLQERERLRDLFGRHVGRAVAEAAEERDPELGGRGSRVGVVFVDIIGSTEMAVDRDPAEVVEVLNRFFRVVVETVDEHDGIIDKFLGDAALVVFGAPNRLDDPAGAALACARDLADRLPQRVPGCRAGIGASFGEVVAGYVGADDRFEYTVIGDAVNEASRLCELAKERPGLLLASGAAVAAAAADESARWETVGSEVVRGRTEPTELCVPAG
ncbi:adenylate/guanylate cyclase domain-containing protein [Dietzia sp. 179-F 9C3 NHS]|uniref:adenylate/guanylate cyclase domain-containing protein n=1 Tax=Dietzia sp. 179-F 9C3 NHS TaxID=3374295 RepID=UPI00387A515C